MLTALSREGPIKTGRQQRQQHREKMSTPTSGNSICAMTGYVVSIRTKDGKIQAAELVTSYVLILDIASHVCMEPAHVFPVCLNLG